MQCLVNLGRPLVMPGMVRRIKSEWEVETDRGVTTFLLGSDEDVYPLKGGRALITDSHGIRYLIDDLASMDAHSRRLLERYL